jgi:hypothetical protein
MLEDRDLSKAFMKGAPQDNIGPKNRGFFVI